MLVSLVHDAFCWEQEMARNNLPLETETFASHYFTKVTGFWSGAYRFQVTDKVIMRAEVPRRVDRLRLLFLQRLSPVRMDTSVSWLRQGLVLHTTRITYRGLFCMDSVELFRLHDNGKTFTVEMSQRLAPTSWLTRTFSDGHGDVDHAASCANYQLPWIGGVISQHAKIVEQGVELTQTSLWLSGNVLLLRKV